MLLSAVPRHLSRTWRESGSGRPTHPCRPVKLPPVSGTGRPREGRPAERRRASVTSPFGGTRKACRRGREGDVPLSRLGGSALLTPSASSWAALSKSWGQATLRSCTAIMSKALQAAPSPTARSLLAVAQ
jgi:hypothetical protein